MTTTQSRPRRRRTALLAGSAVIVAIAIAVALALFEPWRLFTRSTVDEALPMALVSAGATTSAPDQSPSAGPTAAPTAKKAAPGAAPAPASASTAREPAAPPVALATGALVDGEHPTSGTASILQLPDGSRYLRLENFSTSDGPDVRVWLTDQQAGGDDWGKYDDGRYLELGDLKGTDGNQNYPIPAGADLRGLTSAVIWCDRFNVAFGSAPIAP